MSRAEFRAYKGLLALLTAALAYLVLCALSYDDPVSYRLMEVRTPVVRQGEKLRVGLAMTMLRSGCSLDRKRIIVDGRGERHIVLREIGAVSAAVGVEQTPEAVTPITEAFAPGRGFYRAVLAFDCPLVALGPVTVPNLLQHYTPKIVLVPDLPFEIVGVER